MTEKDLWKAYRGWAENEPFVRVVKDKRGKPVTNLCW